MDETLLTELGSALAESERLESLAAEGLRALEEAPKPARVLAGRLARRKLGLTVAEFAARTAEGAALLGDLADGKTTVAESAERLESYRQLVGKAGRYAVSAARVGGGPEVAARVAGDVEGIHRLHDALGRILDKETR